MFYIYIYVIIRSLYFFTRLSCQSSFSIKFQICRFYNFIRFWRHFLQFLSRLASDSTTFLKSGHVALRFLPTWSPLYAVQLVTNLSIHLSVLSRDRPLARPLINFICSYIQNADLYWGGGDTCASDIFCNKHLKQ